MALRDEQQFLLLVKKTLLIDDSITFVDDEIKVLINSCELYLHSMGLKETLVESDDKLVEALIIIYVKTFYGFKNDGSVRELPATFNILVKQLLLTSSEGV